MALNSIRDLKVLSSGTKVTHYEEGMNHIPVTPETVGVNVWHGCDNITFNMLTEPASEGGDLNRCQLVDLIEVALEQLKYLNAKFPCEENKHTIHHLEAALNWQVMRTQDRKSRSVEGMNEK